MEMQHISIVAGMVSTIIFTTSYIPMVVRALKTKDLHSYSMANLLLGNLGNSVHWLYIANLPFGPIWFLHGFYTVINALMLLWYLRYTCKWAWLVAWEQQQMRSSKTHRSLWAFLSTASAAVSCGDVAGSNQ